MPFNTGIKFEALRVMQETIYRKRRSGSLLFFHLIEKEIGWTLGKKNHWLAENQRIKWKFTQLSQWYMAVWTQVIKVKILL